MKMFQGISHRIALQFTVFVFLLFMVNGAIFLIVDFQNARRLTNARLDRTVDFLIGQADRFPEFPKSAIPPFVRQHIRIMDPLGKPFYSAPFFEGVPFEGREGYSKVSIDGQEFRMATVAIVRSGTTIGFAQVADVERLQWNDLPRRVLLYLFVSVLVSALTYVAGKAFARESLRPAESAMERLEQFTQDASHELRTPLAALNSSLDLALKTKKYQEGIASAKEDVREITGLIERLLELARLDAFVLTKEVIDLSSLVGLSLEKHRLLAAPRGITIEGIVEPLVQVRGDAGLLRQVLGNLLTNAIKFSNPGGSVRVRLTKRALFVEDTGIGISNTDLPHVFDRFFQAESSRSNEGYGLGLALVRRIIGLHGWEIRVRSTKDHGTTFEIGFTKIKSLS